MTYKIIGKYAGKKFISPRTFKSKRTATKAVIGMKRLQKSGRKYLGHYQTYSSFKIVKRR